MANHKLEGDSDEYFDEDRAISFHDDFDEADSKSNAQVPVRGVGLDLSLATARKDEKDVSRGVQGIFLSSKL
jgi:hypothetical protein